MSKAKALHRTFARYGLYFFSTLLKVLPLWGMYFLTHILVVIGFALTSRQKRIARESLNIAFGDSKSKEEKERIIKKCFLSFGRAMIEMSYYLYHPELVTNRVVMEGKHILDKALKEGNGVIAVTAHFGNFPLMMLYLTLKGYPTSSIIRPTRDEKLEKYLMRKRTQAGLNTIYAIPRKQCVEQSLKVLRNNELLFIPLDQNSGSAGSVFVDFFGQKAATATGPIILARRTKAPIIPMFILRQENGLHKIIVEEPIEIEEKGEQQETLIYNTSKITKLIESYVRKHPHEWGWMHRRWKSRPVDESVK